MRIAIAGFQHETNTFAPKKAAFADFVRGDAWPPLLSGSEVVNKMTGMNLPIVGFTEAAQRAGVDLWPILWCSAEPSSYVTEDAFERIAAMICEGLDKAGAVDAVYLDLHGAMVTEHLEDGEGEVLRRVRDIVGRDLPVVASLDLHANVTLDMVRNSTALAIFRTYPHIDMAATGARAFDLIDLTLKGGISAKAFRRVPYLVPLTSQYTGAEPAQGLYARLPELAGGAVANVDFAFGFPPADIAECGPTIVAYGADQEAVDAAADAMLESVAEAESRFDNDLLEPREAVRRGMAGVTKKGPVVLADAQDNPGAGGSSDTVGVIEALIAEQAQGAVVAVIDDPEVAAHAHAAGEGASIEAALGGKSGQEGQAPLVAAYQVEKLTDGRFECTGEMYRGASAELGPMALLRVVEEGCDIRILVGSERFQCLDQSVFRHLGVEPTEQPMLVIKSTVHFRADFEPIASQILVVEAPGAHPCRLEGLDYKRLRPGVRLGPSGPVFKPNS